MRIEVDRDICQGHGMCEMEAPELFRAKADTVDLLDPAPDESRRDEVERAVQYCPTQALRIIDDQEG
ncbi:ferredoxin [Williamsia sp. MIQD14]|uniref:ferredoxin n=1 Tax=Williamsia sp. MIQD14 TaxID=3425703 RepID=UPI003DA115C3